MLAALIHLFPKRNLWMRRWACALNFCGKTTPRPVLSRACPVNLLASTPHFGILGLTVEKCKYIPNLKCITGADFSVLHTRCLCLFKEDPLGFTIHHQELIMLKKIKSYKDWSALKKKVLHWMKKNHNCISYKIHEISPGAIQKSNRSHEFIFKIWRYHEKCDFPETIYRKILIVLKSSTNY